MPSSPPLKSGPVEPCWNVPLYLSSVAERTNEAHTTSLVSDERSELYILATAETHRQ